ncbi:hypothetical protein GCM10025866_15550 [Naasia aerilata]|uniref:Uncharacterized protein n=1 Tax=Naasia aerilata TaxID=1162966 RepID=A0ABM8GBP1_9MICO|nr:hypothetical protein GCM10025866_15550 [Naasia aerilata]
MGDPSARRIGERATRAAMSEEVMAPVFAESYEPPMDILCGPGERQAKLRETRSRSGAKCRAERHRRRNVHSGRMFTGRNTPVTPWKHWRS